MGFIEEFPKEWSWITDAFTDPRRRLQVWSRILETMLPAFGFSFLLPPWWNLVLVVGMPLWEFLLFEFILEPSGISGHYFERPPRED